MRSFVYLLALSLGSGCIGDETLTQYGAEGSWQLTQINDRPFEAVATITFEPGGQLHGDGPCNAYSGQQTAPYPWFELSPLRATRRACADLTAEHAYFSALQSMSLSEVSGDVLILSNDQGDRLLFNRLSAPGG